MTKKRYMRSVILTAFLATLVASRIAFAVDEVEPNDPYTNAQSLVIGSDGTVTVNNASIYNTQTHRDVDFYSFHANAGDVVTFNIDGGMDANYNGILTTLAVFGPDPASNPLPLVTAVGSSSPDAGSPTNADARIDNFPIPTTGTYIVGVSTDPGEFLDINSLVTGALSPMGWSPNNYVYGNYTLIISGVTPLAAAAPTPPPVATVLPINIDIMPGRRNVLWIHTASANQTSTDHDSDRRRDLAREMHGHFKGGIPVALLSTDTFNALDVNQSSLRFGSTGTEDSLMRCNPKGVDVNHDGRPDLLCHFDVRRANFEPGDANGIVTGETNSGDAFEGQGYLKIVTGKRDVQRDLDRHDRRHHR